MSLSTLELDIGETESVNASHTRNCTLWLKEDAREIWNGSDKGWIIEPNNTTSIPKLEGERQRDNMRRFQLQRTSATRGEMLRHGSRPAGNVVKNQAMMPGWRLLEIHEETRLAHLAIEIMPLHFSPGTRSWKKSTREMKLLKECGRKRWRRTKSPSKQSL